MAVGLKGIQGLRLHFSHSKPTQILPHCVELDPALASASKTPLLCPISATSLSVATAVETETTDTSSMAGAAWLRGIWGFGVLIVLMILVDWRSGIVWDVGCPIDIHCDRNRVSLSQGFCEIDVEGTITRIRAL
ncbi:hypothetical protein Drorol1_Dr00007660 [Drosera rotundifolia]